jgi:hypothetical protein
VSNNLNVTAGDPPGVALLKLLVAAVAAALLPAAPLFKRNPVEAGIRDAQVGG